MDDKVRRRGGRPMRTAAGLALLLLAAYPAPSPGQEAELKKFPLDGIEGVLPPPKIEADTAVSSDGKGSLKITASSPTTFRLFEISDVAVEDARLIYRARLRTEGLEGKAYLEMWCRFPGKGEAFSRGLQDPLSGTTEWKSVETPFLLDKGQKPDLLKLNLVVDGKGTAWIDDIRLLKAPLP